MPLRIDLPRIKNVELIQDSVRCLSQRDLANKYKISKGSVLNILKRKQDYLEDYEETSENNINPSRSFIRLISFIGLVWNFHSL